MDTFQKLRRRLRKAPPDCTALVLDDLLAALAEREDKGVTIIQDMDAVTETAISKALHDRVFAPIGDAASKRVATTLGPSEGIAKAAAAFHHEATRGTPCLLAGDERVILAIDALEDLGWSWRSHLMRLERDGKTIMVARSANGVTGRNVGALWLCGGSAHMHRVARQALRLPPGLTIIVPDVEPRETQSERLPSADGPALPPGCRLERRDGDWHVVDRHGCTMGPVRDSGRGWEDPHRAAGFAWDRFGAFMSREDYEAMERDCAVGAELEVEHMRKREAAAEQDLRRALERCSIRVPDGLGAMASELALTVERLREDLAERTREHAAALDARSGEAEQEAARLRTELVNARQARSTAEKQACIAQGEAERLREVIERKPAPWHGNALCFTGIQGRRYALVEVVELDPAERERLLADPRRMGGESLDEFRVRLAAEGKPSHG